MSNVVSPVEAIGHAAPIVRSRRSLGLDVLVLVSIAALLALASNAVSLVGINWVSSTKPRTNGVEAQEHIRNLGFDPVDLAYAQKIVADGQHLIFDARSAIAFAKGHLPGAMSLPSKDAQTRVSEFLPLLMPEQPVMVYCSGHSCTDSLDLAIVLKQQGLARVLVFAGGYAEWSHAGLEYETGE